MRSEDRFYRLLGWQVKAGLEKEGIALDAVMNSRPGRAARSRADTHGLSAVGKAARTGLRRIVGMGGR